MRVLAIVHQRDAGPGVFVAAIGAAGHRLDEWLLPEDPPPADPLGYDAVLVLGGAMNADEGERLPWLAEENRLLGELLERSTPLLGLCLGGQTVSAAAGGAPARASEPEIGWHEVEVTAAGRADPLLGPLAPHFEAFQWHSYEMGLPPAAIVLACSPVCAQAARLGQRAWALQFHPEVSAADADAWIADYRSDPDAVRIGVDPAALGAETATKIAAGSTPQRSANRLRVRLLPRSGGNPHERPQSLPHRHFARPRHRGSRTFRSRLGCSGNRRQRRLRGRQPQRLTAAAAGSVVVPIKPTGKGLKALGANGKLAFKLNVSFTPTGGTASTQPATGRLKLTPPKR